MSRTDWQELDFYVSMRRAERTALLAGPYSTLTEAMRNVDRARTLACELDQWAWFDLFGTCHLPRDPANPEGKLNGAIGYEPVQNTIPSVVAKKFPWE